MFTFITNLFRKKVPTGVSNQIHHFLQTNATPFGSRVWGGAKKHSDYDYAMSESHEPLLRQLLQLQSIRTSSAGVYDAVKFADDFLTFQVNEKKYHILLFSRTSQLSTFVHAIQLSTLFFQNTTPTRPERIYYFTHILHMLATVTNVLDPEVNTFVREHCPELFI